MKNLFNNNVQNVVKNLSDYNVQSETKNLVDTSLTLSMTLGGMTAVPFTKIIKGTLRKQRVPAVCKKATLVRSQRKTVEIISLAL